MTLHRALRVPDDRDLVARREPRAHGRSSTNAGTATPGREVLERGGDAVADVQRDVGAVEQPADHAQLGLLVELDVDEHEREVVVEAGRNDCRTMVHERIAPRPLTGSNANAGSVL